MSGKKCEWCGRRLTKMSRTENGVTRHWRVCTNPNCLHKIHLEPGK